jgi:hypothetical protein
MAGFDIIGDVHGCAFKLEALLKDLGYRLDPWSGVFRHDSRQAIFVGDLIDRGPSQLRVLEVVKGMVDSGSAQATRQEERQPARGIPQPADRSAAGPLPRMVPIDAPVA